MTEKPRAANPDTTGSAPGGSASAGPAEGRAAERVVIRDKRKIRPGDDGGSSGPAADAGAESPGEAEPVDAADAGTGAADEAAVETALAEDSEEVAEAAEAEVAGASGGDAPVVDAPAEPVVEAPAEPVVEAPVEPVVEAPAAGRSGSGPLGAELGALRSELDERTRDLQRVTAEYANYRKRVDRDRGLVAEQTTGTVLAALLPILDDLDRAREHGDLVGPFGTVAEQLTGAVGKLGLTPFGEKGDPFDPTRHEAVAHLTSAEVTEPTCIDVMRRGYLLGERLLRPALVAVADPE